MKYLTEYFKNRTAKFYIILSASLLLFISSILYWACYPADKELAQYYTVAVPLILLFTSLALPVLLMFDVTSKFASSFLWMMTLIAFSLNMATAYMYLTTVFFGGVTAEAFADMNMGFFIPILFMLIVLIASFVCIFLKSCRKEATSNEK